MNPGKIIVIALVSYVSLVVGFESLIGFFQPKAGSTLTITTIEPDGARHDRVLSRLQSQGRLYVAANHWPRAWYERALANPEVEVNSDEEQGRHTAVPVTGQEHDLVEADNPLPSVFRFITGYPPRLFLRLDPR